MSHLVTIAEGYTQVSLPDGNLYDEGDEVVLTDEEFNDVSASALGEVVIDGGYVLSGMPLGGTTGQVLSKASEDDGDVEWADLPS